MEILPFQYPIRLLVLKMWLKCYYEWSPNLDSLLCTRLSSLISNCDVHRRTKVTIMGFTPVIKTVNLK